MWVESIQIPSTATASLFPRIFSVSSWSQASIDKFLGLSQSWLLSGLPTLCCSLEILTLLRVLLPTLFLITEWVIFKFYQEFPGNNGLGVLGFNCFNSITWMSVDFIHVSSFFSPNNRPIGFFSSLVLIDPSTSLRHSLLSERSLGNVRKAEARH